MAMRRITGSDLLLLNGEEWCRVQHSLKQRFAGFDSGNIISIGFGAKRCGDEARHGLLAARFHVRHKWKSDRKAAKSREPVPAHSPICTRSQLLA